MRPESSRKPLTWPLEKRPSSLGEAHIGPCEISVNALSQRILPLWNSGPFPPFYVHFHALPRAQCHPLQRHDDMALHQIEAEGAQKMREQDDPLLHREGHADAHARPRAEWNVGETVDPIALFAEEISTGRRRLDCPRDPFAGAGHRARSQPRSPQGYLCPQAGRRRSPTSKHRRRGIGEKPPLEDGAKDFAPL